MENPLLAFLTGIAIAIYTVPKMGIFVAYNFPALAIVTVLIFIFIVKYIDKIVNWILKRKGSFFLFSILCGISLFLTSVFLFELPNSFNIINITNVLSLFLIGYTSFKYGIRGKIR